MIENLKQNYKTTSNDINIHTLILRVTSCLLFLLIFTKQSIATNDINNTDRQSQQNNQAGINYSRIKHYLQRFADKTEKILGPLDSWKYSLSTSITEWVFRSLYNSYTKHNDKKYKWYRGHFFIYGGRKFKITKNIYLDWYYSLINLFFYMLIENILLGVKRKYTKFRLRIEPGIILSLNIRINKNFYICFSPMKSVWIIFQ